MGKLTNLFGAAALAVVSLFAMPAAAQGVPDARLKAIIAMSAEDMAATGAWTRSAYERMLGYIYGIQDKATRELVLDMVLRPETKMFKAKATQSFLASPAAGGKGHHYYPGGLPVHALEWIEVAMAWADAYERVYRVRKLNRDLIVAALVLHDWAKVWYEWDPATAAVVKPQWYPQSWGGDRGKAKWKWMGEHGAVVYAELMVRGAPDALVVATAASHFDPHWDLDKEGEGLNPALAEAAKIADKPPIVVKHRQQMAEWWFSTYTDGSWSYSHYIAGHFALDAVESVAVDLGLKAGSLEANKLSWFVLSRVSDYRIYDEYQNAGFSMDAAKKLILSVIQDSSPYEVAKN
jgi:hypothetical protein